MEKVINRGHLQKIINIKAAGFGTGRPLAILSNYKKLSIYQKKI